MPRLTIRRGSAVTLYDFSGTPTLSQALAAAGMPVAQPCGGRGVCGKCAVGALTGLVEAPTGPERRAGARLACQARLLGDCDVTLPDAAATAAVETTAAPVALGTPMAGRYGAAIDLGTTTLVARVYDLRTGEPMAERAALNPQGAVSADVMGRLSAALAGEGPRLTALARGAVRETLAEACAQAGVSGVDSAVLAGNTVMLTLLTGRDPRPLATAPFQAECLFGLTEDFDGMALYLPPCAGAFLGADLTCAALSTGLSERPETTLLMDIGTNGELMLWHRGRLYAASTPAGPALEGGSISQGCGSVAGAIDRVWAEPGGLGVRVIGGGAARGVCGSGIVDAVAALLTLGWVDRSGASDAAAFPLAPGVRLTAADIRAVQLAKAAVAAGTETLLAAANARPAEVARLLLAGGFGTRLNVQSAAAVGLLPAALAGRAQAVGNASLAGAAALLLDTRLRAQAESMASNVRSVALGGDAGFEARFLAAMDFPLGARVALNDEDA